MHMYFLVILHELSGVYSHSGGTEYMIEGTNLHIVQEPRLQVHIVTPAGSEERRRRQTVEVIKSPVRNLI